MEKHVEIGLGRMSYLEEGQGPPVVFIHGWPMNKQTFLPIIDLLKDAYRCISLDLLDIGGSRPVKGDAPFSFPQHARAILEALDKIGIQRFSLVGQDSGGFISRLVADIAGARVDQLILFNTELPGHIPPWVPLFQMLTKFPLAATVFRTSLKTKLIARSPMGFGGCFMDKRLIFGDFYDRTAAPLLKHREQLGGALRFLDVMDWEACRDLKNVHPRLKAKVHFIWGDKDPFFPLTLAKEVFKQFTYPGEFVVIHNTKLLPYYEQPRVVADHMKRMLGSQPVEADTATC
ncbi:alpha/beta fold hydrolase [Caldimonas brevitalea]|uniref:Alpha/beta hydrolase fold n=1 Tax=Caldimonas brevitalea TaxID=413882 RepID=A0A0G3BNV8_9BURK|nr:alpha/beta hydrolase [Caldimonas brevitalea]AKJ29036.1 alpha/beta hydrolase fold [Caldimonas brevitalea]